MAAAATSIHDRHIFIYDFDAAKCVEEYISVGPFSKVRSSVLYITFVTIAVSSTDRLVFAVHGGVC